MADKEIMSLEDALKVLELNVICSPKAVGFKKAVDVVKGEINNQQVEIEKKELERSIEFYKSEYDLQFEANRKLRSEVEKLKEDLDARDVAMLRLDHEKDRLSEELDHQKAIAEAELYSMHNLVEDYRRALEEEQQHIREAKVEAVKEFAERLKEKPSVINCEYEWLHIDIDNLVAEMVGDTDE